MMLLTQKDPLTYLQQDSQTLLLSALIVVATYSLVLHGDVSGDDAIKLYAGILGFVLGSGRSFKQRERKQQ